MPLFNGRDLAGWRGCPHLDPRQDAAGTPAERDARQKQRNDDLTAHWKAQDGVIVSDGHGVIIKELAAEAAAGSAVAPQP